VSSAVITLTARRDYWYKRTSIRTAVSVRYDEEPVMRIGFHLTPFWSPATRDPTQLIDEAIRLVAAASRLGFAWVSAPHHWLGHPSFFPHPFPILARLAPEAAPMRLKTNVLILPLVNAVDAAESIATLDHIAHGRLDVGVGIGYRETELAAAGVSRKDRVPKLEESIALMKQLWSGEEVAFEGRYTRVLNGRMGYRPYQTPHPFLEMAAQSVGATERAARLADGVFFGPQVGWRDVERLTGVYRRARTAARGAAAGTILASRSLIVGPSKEAAAAAAREFLEKTFNQYRSWDMQEKTMVPLRLGFDESLDDWAVYGSPRDCVEALQRGGEMGLDGVGLTMYSLPRDVQARIEYLHMVAEQILKAAGATPP
jgi:alkanesulfonate monooxygenase SsuD/methylene tetrahydromethanopterin reductase-like flavin-dependent oxidoreductase (luciferase family)